MSTPTENQPEREVRWIYITSIILLVVFVLAGLLVFRSAKRTSQASTKADQLIAALRAAGVRTPDKDQVVRVLGADGGATCDHPNEALTRTTMLAMMMNGAAGPGQRPVVVDSRIIRGQLLIIKIYCPDQLQDFRQWIDDLKTADVVNQ